MSHSVVRWRHTQVDNERQVAADGTISSGADINVRSAQDSLVDSNTGDIDDLGDALLERGKEKSLAREEWMRVRLGTTNLGLLGELNHLERM